MAPVIRTARERAREELTLEIKKEARRQLAEEGAQRLSLRAVARELGMASSALYRYFPSRDELLTALIIDAYNALGERAELAVAEAAAASRSEPREAWRALCTSVRAWAVEHPHEYALLYGTPVPGYAAPQETIAPAGRGALAMIGVLRSAADRTEPPTPVRPLRGAFAEQISALGGALAPEVGAGVLSRGLVAWTQLFGMISFELFGQLVGTLDPADDFFAHTVEEMADFIGLPQ